MKYPKLLLDERIMHNAEAFLDEMLPLHKLTLNNSYRSYEEQYKLYQAYVARGRKGNPAAKPGTSKHESGFAFDLNRLPTLPFIRWDRLLNVGEKYGFHYLLGDFPGEGFEKFDWPHFEVDPRAFEETYSQAIVTNRIREDKISTCSWESEPTAEEKAYLSQISIAGVSYQTRDFPRLHLVFLNGVIANKGPKLVRQIELKFEHRDSLGEITSIRFAYPVTLHAAPLKPSEIRPIHVGLGVLWMFDGETTKLDVTRVNLGSSSPTASQHPTAYVALCSPGSYSLQGRAGENASCGGL